jgi:type II secretory pathway pseudopilin PulG
MNPRTLLPHRSRRCHSAFTVLELLATIGMFGMLAFIVIAPMVPLFEEPESKDTNEQVEMPTPAVLTVSLP